MSVPATVVSSVSPIDKGQKPVSFDALYGAIYATATQFRPIETSRSIGEWLDPNIGKIESESLDGARIALSHICSMVVIEALGKRSVPKVDMDIKETCSDALFILESKLGSTINYANGIQDGRLLKSLQKAAQDFLSPTNLLENAPAGGIYT